MTPLSPSDIEAGRTFNRENRTAGAPHDVRRNTLRVAITIPWEHLVPDNAKYGVIRGRMLLRAEYREAKDTIQHIARRAMEGLVMLDGNLEWHAQLYMPDRRRRDATNYAKLTQDALQGAVYLDDTQIKKATWENCGIDRENPRCYITIKQRAA